MKHFVSLFIIAIFLSSCYSYRIFPAEYRNFEYSGEKQMAFLLNPELKKEAGILRNSGIFKFTDDSLNKQAVRVKLFPFKRSLACGQPIVASLITLGQLPVFFPDRYQFKFEEIRNGDSTHRNFELLIAQRTWFWDLFVIHKKFREKAGKALLANYYRPLEMLPLTLKRRNHL